VAKNGTLSFTLTAPEAGTFTANGTTIVAAVRSAHIAAVRSAHIATHRRKLKRRRISFGTASATAAQAGTITLVLRPSAAARAALAKGERLTVVVTITFRPANGGAASSRQATVNVSLPKRKRH
jgi:hypothetical protein